MVTLTYFSRSQSLIKERGCQFCETQWPRPPLFSPSWLIQWSMGEGSYVTLFSLSDVTAFHRMKYGGGVLYNLIFTEWSHCVSQNTMSTPTMRITSILIPVIHMMKLKVKFKDGDLDLSLKVTEANKGNTLLIRYIHTYTIQCVSFPY